MTSRASDCKSKDQTYKVTCMFCSYSFRNLDKDAKMPVPFIMLDGISQFQIRSERKVCKSVSEKSDTRSDSAIASFDE